MEQQSLSAELFYSIYDLNEACCDVTDKTIDVDLHQPVAVIHLNRPAQRNAISSSMADELLDAVDGCNRDDSVRTIVITGRGEAFSAGFDISEWREGAPQADPRFGRPESGWVQTVVQSKPIVVAINGAAIGMGLTLALPCDIRIASDVARFSFRFVKVGVAPELASSRLLADLVGAGAASELMLSGRTFGAEEAERIALVSQVVPAEALMTVALEKASELAANPPEAVMGTKRLLWQRFGENELRRVQENELAEIKRLQDSPGFRESVARFLKG